MAAEHYKGNGTECIDVMREVLTAEEFEGFLKGNVIKYIFRAESKGSKGEDLAKAADYACMLAHDMWLGEIRELVEDD